MELSKRETVRFSQSTFSTLENLSFVTIKFEKVKNRGLISGRESER